MKYVGEDSKYWLFEDGNRYTKMYYTLEMAKETALTLVACSDCTDCKHCYDCVGCVNCLNCGSCDWCRGCYDCIACANSVKRMSKRCKQERKNKTWIGRFFDWIR